MAALDAFLLPSQNLPGWHIHKCPRCDQRWQHNGRCLGDSERAHTCPQCGQLELRIDQPLASRSPLLPELDGKGAPLLPFVLGGLVLGGVVLLLASARPSRPEGP